MERKKITFFIRFLSIHVIILGSPTTYFKCSRDKHEGMRCTRIIFTTVFSTIIRQLQYADLHGWITILPKWQNQSYGMGYRGGHWREVLGKVVLGCWDAEGKHWNPVLF